MSALIVGTDGTPELDRRVREAAHVARALSVPLHVVCSVEPLSGVAQRQIDRSLPGDLSHMAGRKGQRQAAVQAVRSLVGDRCELHVTAVDSRLKPALRDVARTVGGELYGTSGRRLRLPVIALRARATA